VLKAKTVNTLENRLDKEWGKIRSWATLCPSTTTSK